MKETRRQKIHSSLTNALPYLWNGRSRQEYYKNRTLREHLCFAITVGNNDSFCSAYATNMIADRIEPYTTVGAWLEGQGVKGITSRRLQSYRKKWLKSLIAEFAPKKG